MKDAIAIQGRILKPADLDTIRDLMISHRDWNRTRLSRELCALWDWRTPTGQIKDMACRTLLLKLDRRGLIHLPARQGPSVNHRRGKAFEPVLHDTMPRYGSLAELGRVRLVVVDKGDDLDLWQTLLHGYHYLGFSTRVGKNIAYLALDDADRPVGSLLFGAAAWKVAGRDDFIGWTHVQRQRNLEWIANNTRFLIPPWIRVPHLASHILALAARRISKDWQHKYGHGLVLLETFVENGRFRGTCYRAANWICVGQTTGRTRNDRNRDIQSPVKSIYVYPLHRAFRCTLTHEHQGRDSVEPREWTRWRSCSRSGQWPARDRGGKVSKTQPFPPYNAMVNCPAFPNPLRQHHRDLSHCRLPTGIG